MNVNLDALLYAFGVSRFFLGDSGAVLLEFEVKMFQTSTELVAAVREVLGECGTAMQSSFESMSDETFGRIRAVVPAYLEAYVVYEKETNKIRCRRIEKELESLIHSKKKDVSSVAATETDDDGDDINARMYALNVAFMTINPERFQQFGVMMHKKHHDDAK